MPGTGNTAAFVAVKAAYDIIGNVDKRADYDRRARHIVSDTFEPGEIPAYRPAPMSPAPTRAPRFSDLPLAAWGLLGAILLIGIYQVVVHLMVLPPPPARLTVATTVAPSPPSPTEAQRLEDYGPTPVRLAGTPNFYVIQAAGVTVLWRIDEAKKALVPVSRLPPFSSVQALRLFRQNGLVEVKVTDSTTGFVQAARLAPGDANAAHNAYCAYNAGAPPTNGEVFRQTARGEGHIALDNRTSQPVVVKLRDASGSAVLTTYLSPGGHTDLQGLPVGKFRPDYAIGELWSRACQTFAAGMQARRWGEDVTVGGLTTLAIPPDHPGPDISDDTFHRD